MKFEIDKVAKELKKAAENNPNEFYTQVAYILYSGGSSSEIVKLEEMIKEYQK